MEKVIVRYICRNMNDWICCQNMLFDKGYYWQNQTGKMKTINIPDNDSFKFPIVLHVYNEFRLGWDNYNNIKNKSYYKHYVYTEFNTREKKLERILKDDKTQ